jgi:hypothetical protein
LALVKNPASGHRFHLLKSAPEADSDLEALVDSLSEEEAAELLEACEVRPDVEQRLDRIEAKLAKAEPVIRARQALRVGVAKSQPDATAAALATLAREAERGEIVERQRRIIREMHR